MEAAKEEDPVAGENKDAEEPTRAMQIPVREQVVVAKTLRYPGEPTKLERIRHALTHLPYRAWCKLCVMGRG